MTTLSEDYEQQPIYVNLKAIELHELRQRSLGRPTDSFVTVSVDGEQQFQTPLVQSDLSPSWQFTQPYKLSVFPSSLIMFTIYRERKTELFGKKYLGVYEAPLFSYLSNNRVPHELDTRHCITSETGTVTVDLEVDTSGERPTHDGHLQNATQRLRNVHARAKRSRSPKHGIAAASAVLEQALDHLDHIVHAVDGLVDIHPWCKTAWTLLSSVYKALRKQHERDGQVNDLILALRDALARATQCRDLKAKSGTTSVVAKLAKTVAEGATLIDEYMKHSSAGKLVRAATGFYKSLDKRIEQYRARLRELYGELLVDLAIDAFHKSERRESANSAADQPPSTTELSEPTSWSQPPIATTPPPAPPSSCWQFPGAPRTGTPASSVFSSPRQTPRPLAEFPTPILYPDVEALCDSPGAMRRNIELPEAEPYFPPTPPSSAGTQSRRLSASSVQEPVAQHPRNQRRRWHSDFEANMLKNMFTTLSDDVIEEVLLAKGSQTAAIDVLLQMTNEESPQTSIQPSPHHCGKDTVNGLGLTVSPVPTRLPNLSRSTSCNSNNSMVTTPASETRPDGSEHTEGICDGYVGGFAMPSTQPLTLTPKRNMAPPRWVPGTPIL